MQHTDKMRAEFEAWCTDADDGPQVDPMWMAHFDPATNEYALDQIQRDWRTWLASRRELVIELPEPIHGIEEFGYKAGAVRAAIEAAGVKVKE